MSNTPSQTLVAAGRRHHKWATRINNISATFRSEIKCLHAFSLLEVFMTRTWLSLALLHLGLSKAHIKGSH